MYPLLWTHVNMSSQGGVHDRQILSRQNAIEFSRNLPGCLPVARKILEKKYSPRFSSFFTSNCQNLLFSTSNSDFFWNTVYIDSWASLESSNSMKNCKKWFLDFYVSLFLRLLAVILVPELFRKLRETPGKNSHQVWSKSEILYELWPKNDKVDD